MGRDGGSRAAETAVAQALARSEGAEALAAWTHYLGVKAADLVPLLAAVGEAESFPAMAAEATGDRELLLSVFMAVLERKPCLSPPALQRWAFEEIILPKAGLTRAEYDRLRQAYEAHSRRVPPMEH